MSRNGVLLLGGAGFIGSALAKRLEQEGTSAYILGRHNWEQIEQMLPQCSTVIHLASATTPGTSATLPCLELGNLAVTLRLLDLIQKRPEIHLVFFSSGGTVYGNPDRLPVTEDTPIAPLSNHGAGKAAQEAFCQALRAQSHAVTILRPANAYGPGQTLRHGFGLVQVMLESARVGTPMEIWGDGENVRDFVYIDDVVEACSRLIALPDDNGTYNLGSGTGCSINQLRGVVERITGKRLTIKRREAREIDVRAIVLDSTRLEQRLSWKPETRVEDGVRRTWEWMSRQQ